MKLSLLGLSASPFVYTEHIPMRISTTMGLQYIGTGLIKQEYSLQRNDVLFLFLSASFVV